VTARRIWIARNLEKAINTVSHCLKIGLLGRVRCFDLIQQIVVLSFVIRTGRLGALLRRFLRGAFQSLLGSLLCNHLALLKMSSRKVECLYCAPKMLSSFSDKWRGRLAAAKFRAR